MKRPLTALAAVLLCTACAPAVTTAGLASPSAAASASLSAGGRSQAPGGTVPPTAGITWDAESKTEAAVVATRAMADYARPEVEATQWANDFARWLTPQATADYSTVDPANIPVSHVTGPATVAVDDSNGYGVTVTVPTDIGPYAVQLLRTSKDSTWKVNRLTPPASG